MSSWCSVAANQRAEHVFMRKRALRERDERTAGRGRARARTRTRRGLLVDVMDFPRVTAETGLWRGPFLKQETFVQCV